MPEVRPAKILVVDDNPATLYSTARVLRGAGFETVEAVTGEQGVTMAVRGVDAVVLDVHLPDMSGFEVCKQLRLIPATTRVPVIHLSATLVQDTDKVNGLESGADGYLTHPVEPPVLIATVKAFLRARSAEEQREQLLISERAARAQAERANRVKDDFLATLSHELRTPLNAIVGWSQLLRRGDVDAEELAEGLEAIERNAIAQNQLIADLLDVSRITSGKLRLDIKPVDLSAIANASLDAVKHAAQAKNIRLIKSVELDGAVVSGDPGRLQQVMWNLVNNAVKFTPAGGNIGVYIRLIDTRIEIKVTDDGDGISEALLPHIFNRFQQGDATTTRHHGGLGLGLSIVRHLVEMHGGTVMADSGGRGKGSTFTVILPASPPLPKVQDPSPEEPKRAMLGEIPHVTLEDLTGLKVMVVDDDHDGRSLLMRLLSHAGAKMCDAQNATAALEKLADFKPDVLVSDIGMPGVDGYDLLREVRARGFTSETLPAIALTAFARDEDHRAAMLAGYQVHLAKPVNAGQLVSAISELAGRGLSTAGNISNNAG